MSDKLKIIELLQKTHDAIYDADDLIGKIRTSKDTAEPLRQILKRLGMADAYLTEVLDADWWR